MRTQLITLKHGFDLGGKQLKEVVIREANLGDMMAAEEDAPVYNNLSFTAALACRCIEKLEGYDGMVTMAMMRTLSPTDWSLIRGAMNQMEEAGNV